MASTAATVAPAAPASIESEVSRARLYVLRALYLLLVIGGAVVFLPQLIGHEPTARGVIPSMLGGLWVPAFLLTFRGTASRRGWLLSAAALACCGILMNRFVMTVQTLALPTLAFDEFLQYTPSWQELASFGAVVAYGVIVYSLSYRYLSLFPRSGGENSHVSGH